MIRENNVAALNPTADDIDDTNENSIVSRRFKAVDIEKVPDFHKIN